MSVIVLALCEGVLAAPRAIAQSDLQDISPSTCNYNVATDFSCTLPPGSTIKLPMSAPAVTPEAGWHCIAGEPATSIVYDHQPSPDAAMSISWVPQEQGACGKVSGYALVTVASNARPQYLAADFFLGNAVGECKDGTDLCTNGIADNGTRWSLDISQPPYVISFHQKVATKDFPAGTSPYTFADYPPAASSPATTASTVTCNVTTTVTPAPKQFGYGTTVGCSSKNGIVGSVNYLIERAWPDRVDYIPGPVYQCDAKQSCQTPNTTFKTYGDFPGVYTVFTFVNLLNPMNDEGLPGDVIQSGGTNYQMMPYNNLSMPYPLVNPEGWQGTHVPFPDTERLFNFANCPAAVQGSASYPKCPAANTPQLRSNTITFYQRQGFRVPKGVTASSSGRYVTQYIKPVECGGGTEGSNGVFLKPTQAEEFSSWWNDFSPCAPAPPTVSWKTPRKSFTKYPEDTLPIAVHATAAGGAPTVTLRASYPGYTDPANHQNHWFTIATISAPAAGNVYSYNWNLRGPDGSYLPAGAVSLMATACTAQINCTSITMDGQMRTRYFLFATGLTTAYDSAIAQDTGFSDLRVKLQLAYPSAHSGYYLYPCHNGGCNGHNYTAADTCSDTLTEDAHALATQIHAYASSHANTDMYVIGDSLGGVTAFGYLADQRASGWPTLPGGNKVKGVVSIDAPLGGIPPLDLTATTLVFNGGCYGSLGNRPIPILTQLTHVPNPDTTGSSGGTARLAHFLFPTVGKKVSNDALARSAARHDMRVLSVGNTLDFGFTLSGSKCIGLLQKAHIPAVDLTNSQFLDEQAPWGVYSRTISIGMPSNSCIDDIKNQVNHGVAMSDPTVETGIINFIAGNAPAPIAVH